MVLSADRDILYPDSDGQPMADNTQQFRWIVLLKENLECLYANNPNVFVAGDLRCYPVEGHPEIQVAPDAMVAIGRPIETMADWTSPQLRIRFVLTAETLEVYYPNGQPFLKTVELAQRAEQFQTKERLAAKLRELGIDPETLT